MINKQVLYAINLENCWYPKRLRPKKGYIGTKEDLEAFATKLEEKHWSKKAATSAAIAIRSHFDGKSPKSMIEKYGDSFEYVHTLKLIHQANPITLENHYWQYRAVNDAIYPMYADRITVGRIIFSAYGVLHTAIKGSVEGLHVCLQGIGWIALKGIMNGFPETVTYDYEEEMYEMRLFALDCRLQPEEKDEMIKKWSTNEDVDLEFLCQDIIAEGIVDFAAKNDHPLETEE